MDSAADGLPLERSIACYREILAVYRRIREAVAAGAAAEALNGWLDRVQDLDREAREADARFQAEAAAAGIALEDLAGISRWQSLLEAVQQENQAMRRHIRAAMTVIKDDLSRMEKGRQALSGYRSGRSSAGTRLNFGSA